MVVALSIAGADGTGRAGVYADLRAFAACGVQGTAAITAVTAQNDRGVFDVTAMSPRSVRAQVEAVGDQFEIAAVKTGMLATADLVEEVAAVLGDRGRVPVVVDPVVLASSGGRLLEEKGVRVVLDRLLPLCTVFTPNIPEAELFLGRPVNGRDAMASAAEDLALVGPRAVLLKGGHLGGETSPDLLWFEGIGYWMEGSRHPGAYRGTGCALSAALTAYLARGWTIRDACAAAKEYVLTMMGRSAPG